MGTSVLKLDRQLPERKWLRDHIRSVYLVYQTSGVWRVDKPSGCDVKKEARKKYKGRSAKTRIDDVETEEDAHEYLERVKRRHEEGKTTRLP